MNEFRMFLTCIGAVTLWLAIGWCGVRIGRTVDKAFNAPDRKYIPDFFCVFGPVTIAMTVVVAVIVGSPSE